MMSIRIFLLTILILLCATAGAAARNDFAPISGVFSPQDSIFEFEQVTQKGGLVEFRDSTLWIRSKRMKPALAVTKLPLNPNEDYCVSVRCDIRKLGKLGVATVALTKLSVTYSKLFIAVILGNKKVLSVATSDILKEKPEDEITFGFKLCDGFLRITIDNQPVMELPAEEATSDRGCSLAVGAGGISAVETSFISIGLEQGCKRAVETSAP